MAFPTNFFDDYQSVRAALSLSLTEADIPDSVIQLPIYQGTAISEIEEMFPDLEIGDIYASIAILGNDTQIAYRPPFELVIGQQAASIDLMYQNRSEWSIEYGLYNSTNGTKQEAGSSPRTGTYQLEPLEVRNVAFSATTQAFPNQYFELSEGLEVNTIKNTSLDHVLQTEPTDVTSSWTRDPNTPNRWYRTSLDNGTTAIYTINLNISFEITEPITGGTWDGVALVPPTDWDLVSSIDSGENDLIPTGVTYVDPVLLGSDNITVQYLTPFRVASGSRLIVIYQRKSTAPARPIGGSKILDNANNLVSPYLRPPDNWDLNIPPNLTASQITRFKTAIAYRIAARLLLSRPEVVSHSVLGITTRWQVVDPEKKREALLALSNKLLSDLAKELGITDPISYQGLTSIFKTAKGKRGEIFDPRSVSGIRKNY